jgi:hypothetical protein
MARRPRPEHKDPSQILEDVLAGHKEASFSGHDRARKYLDRLLSERDSVPNAVKFFVYDLLSEDCWQVRDPDATAEAVKKARELLPLAREEARQAFERYRPQLRCFERGISAATDQGEYELAAALCDEAVALGLGPVYEAKRNSLARNL